MEYTMMPVVDICDLEDLAAKVGIPYYEVRDLLFDSNYSNDCYLVLDYSEDCDPEWDDNADARNKIYKALRELNLPGDCKAVMVDVSW